MRVSLPFLEYKISSISNNRGHRVMRYRDEKSQRSKLLRPMPLTTHQPSILRPHNLPSTLPMNSNDMWISMDASFACVGIEPSNLIACENERIVRLESRNPRLIVYMKVST